MNKTVENFVDCLIEKMREEKFDSNDSVSLAAILIQQLEKCTSFASDIEKQQYTISIDTTPNPYCPADLLIEFIQLPYFYKINFAYDFRSKGYCQCKDDDAGYHPKHKCCGHSCDWYAPSFSILKIESSGKYDWIGNETEYWEAEEYIEKKYTDKFLNRETKIQKINQVEIEIKKLESELKNLKKEY